MPRLLEVIAGRKLKLSMPFFEQGFGFFGLMLNIPVNSYSHVRMVSSPNHTFYLGKLDQVVNQYFVHIFRL